MRRGSPRRRPDGFRLRIGPGVVSGWFRDSWSGDLASENPGPTGSGSVPLGLSGKPTANPEPRQIDGRRINAPRTVAGGLFGTG